MQHILLFTRSDLVFFLRPLMSGRRLLGLTALSLAAAGSYGCAHVPGFSRNVAAGRDTLPGAPTTIVRRYAGAPTTTVMGWSTNEAYQGLRASVRDDGSLVRDHHVFVSGFAVPNTASLQYGRSSWFAFTNGMTEKAQLQVNGGMRDPFNCDQTEECSPLIIYTARVPDEFLRASRDSIVVRMEEVNGMSETNLTLQADMVKRYLAVVDSVSTVRRRTVATR